MAYLIEDKMRDYRSSRVRRRLFVDEEETRHPAIRDNLDNILQESRQRDKNNMKQKWNFDFDNEVPLDGTFKWYRLNAHSWVAVEPDQCNNTVCKVEDDLFSLGKSLEKENQCTPRTNTSEVAPVIRKRKRNDINENKGHDKDGKEVNDKGAKRKIYFD